MNDEIGGNNRITFVFSNDVFAKVYNILICKIDVLLYMIKYNI